MASFQKRDPEPHDEKFKELLASHGGSPLMVFDAFMDYCSYHTDLFGADSSARLQEFSYVFNKYNSRWNARETSKLVVYDENIQQRVRRQALLYERFIQCSNVEMHASEESFADTGNEDGDQLRRFARYHKFFQQENVESYGGGNEDRDQLESNFQGPAPNPLMMVPYNLEPAQGIMLHPGGPQMYRMPFMSPPNGLPNHAGPLHFYSPPNVRYAPVVPAPGTNENVLIPNCPAEHQQQYQGGPNIQYRE